VQQIEAVHRGEQPKGVSAAHEHRLGRSHECSGRSRSVDTDDVDPDRLERVRHNCGVPIPVALRVRHERNLAYTGKCLSQDGQRVL
jgi:hypothetical protein